jgi:hypothetical protein
MIGWLDAQAGASGDMFLGALVDAGVPIELLQSELDRVDLDIRLEQRTVERGGIGARKVDVRAPDSTRHRRLSDVRSLLGRLDGAIRDTARQVFGRLAEAEGTVHRIDPEPAPATPVRSPTFCAWPSADRSTRWRSPRRLCCSKPTSTIWTPGSGRTPSPVTASGRMPVIVGERGQMQPRMQPLRLEAIHRSGKRRRRSGSCTIRWGSVHASKVAAGSMSLARIPARAAADALGGMVVLIRAGRSVLTAPAERGLRPRTWCPT